MANEGSRLVRVATKAVEWAEERLPEEGEYELHVPIQITGGAPGTDLLLTINVKGNAGGTDLHAGYMLGRLAGDANGENIMSDHPNYLLLEAVANNYLATTGDADADEAAVIPMPGPDPNHFVVGPAMVQMSPGAFANLEAIVAA